MDVFHRRYCRTRCRILESIVTGNICLWSLNGDWTNVCIWDPSQPHCCSCLPLVLLFTNSNFSIYLRDPLSFRIPTKTPSPLGRVVRLAESQQLPHRRLLLLLVLLRLLRRHKVRGPRLEDRRSNGAGMSMIQTPKRFVFAID
jgi:hypothetical protein